MAPGTIQKAARDAYRQPINPNDPKPITIGINIGTTSSRVGYSVSGDNVLLFTGYPRPLNLSKYYTRRVASAIAYGRDKSPQWGYAIEDDMDTINCFKLLVLGDLEQYGPVTQWPCVREAQRLAERHNKQPDNLAADYLRFLWDFARHKIENSLRAGSNPRYEIVITVPALRRVDRGIRIFDKMKQIASRAGISNRANMSINFITEAEEASLTMIPRLITHPDGISTGCRIIVVDCGGGPVDMISMEVVKSQPLDVRPLEVDEVDGALCGAKLLDDAFLNLIVDQHGDLWGLASKQARIRLMQRWEATKKAFEDPQDFIHIFHEPPGHEEHLIHISGTQIERVFDDAVGLILRKVKLQVEVVHTATGTWPTHICLTRGFGCSAYLRDELTKAVVEHGIRLFAPADKSAWDAVVNGAVLKAQANAGIPGCNVRTRPLQRTSATNIGFSVDEGPGTAKMCWIVQKGQDVTNKRKGPACVNISVPGDARSVSHILFTCDDDKPPSRKKEGDNLRECLTIETAVTSLTQPQTPLNPQSRVIQFTYNLLWDRNAFKFQVCAGGQCLEERYISVDIDEERSGEKNALNLVLATERSTKAVRNNVTEAESQSKNKDQSEAEAQVEDEGIMMDIDSEDEEADGEEAMDVEEE